MSSLSLEISSRVQCIKQKFEGSAVFEEAKIVPSKGRHANSSVRGSISSATLCSASNISDSDKTDSRGTDGKNHIKRTPAFRREKTACVKTLGKMLYHSQSDGQIVDRLNNLKDTHSRDATKIKMEPWTDNSKLQNLQRFKTDLLNKKCDEKNHSKVNCTKSTLISKKLNLLGERENVESNDILSYAVVDKSQKKKAAEKKQKETELKLSESLRKVLQSPLPQGPPPKKPPRTFRHVLSDTNSFSSKESQKNFQQKDLPQLKSKLDKLENLIRSHDRKSKMTLPNEDFKSSLEDKIKKLPSTKCDSKSLPSALKKKSEKTNCLQLTSCVNPYADVVIDEKLLKQTKSGSIDVNKSNIKCAKLKSSDVNNKNCFFDEAVARRSMSEPIYDLPCVAGKNFPDNNKIGKFADGLDPHSNPEGGLHYLCTDVVNKLNGLKPVEFSSAENWVPNLLGNRTAKSCENFKRSPHVFRDSKSNFDLRKEKEEKTEEETEEDEVEGGGKVGDKAFSPDDGKGILSDGKSIKSDSDSLSMGSESEREWTQASDVSSQDPNEAVKLSSRKEILVRKTAQRKDYVNKVSSRLFNCVPYWMSLKDSNCAHLFECCLLVGLTLESDKNVPYIKKIYPPSVKPPPLIEALCFPDATNWGPNAGSEPEEQYYSLVVTNENGERKFGYCRRVLPEGGNLCLPLTYCIITPHRANGFFYKVLEELESRHGSVGMDNFIKQLYEAEFPGPGEVLKLKKILEEATKTSFSSKDNYIASTLVRRPCDIRLEEKNLTQLFQYLHLPVFIKIFSSLLHERKVLLLSNSLRKLSSCIEALQSTLLPFSWQHTYIPVLPVHLLETCEAPTPYVIGLPKVKNVQNSLENIVFENGIMVDLDESKILKCCGDEGSILPHRLIKTLKTSLNVALNAAMLSEANRNVVISDAFIGFFVQVCGHYSKFICLSDGEKTFEQKGFIKYVTSTTTQSFLEWFTKTAMFQAFIHERLHGFVEDIPVKLFTLRAMENPTEAMKNSAILPLNKVLNKKVKSFSDKIKDFIQ